MGFLDGYEVTVPSPQSVRTRSGRSLDDRIADSFRAQADALEGRGDVKRPQFVEFNTCIRCTPRVAGTEPLFGWDDTAGCMRRVAKCVEVGDKAAAAEFFRGLAQAVDDKDPPVMGYVDEARKRAAARRLYEGGEISR